MYFKTRLLILPEEREENNSFKGTLSYLQEKKKFLCLVFSENC